MTNIYKGICFSVHYRSHKALLASTVMNGLVISPLKVNINPYQVLTHVMGKLVTANH